MSQFPLTRQCAAEAAGTFCLLFAGTGAIIVNDVAGGAISHVGVALTFGLVVMTMIYAVGDVSGAHLNPAVTVGFWLARRFPARQIAAFVLSQAVGALLASTVLRLLFPTHATLGATLPLTDTAHGLVQSFVLELILTAILMFVILGVSHGSKEKGLMAGVAVGGVIAMEAMFAGPVCGASMNPARSLAPAVVSLQLQHLWIYLTAPVCGAAVGVAVFRATHAADDA